LSLVRAPCPGREAQVTSAFDWAIMRMCEYCRAVVAREKLSVIRSGKVAMLVDTGSPLSGWTERAWRAAHGGHAGGGLRGDWYAMTTAALLKTTGHRQRPRGRPLSEISR
jgi:hypothetical protein